MLRKMNASMAQKIETNSINSMEQKIETSYNFLKNRHFKNGFQVWNSTKYCHLICSKKRWCKKIVSVLILLSLGPFAYTEKAYLPYLKGPSIEYLIFTLFGISTSYLTKNHWILSGPLILRLGILLGELCALFLELNYASWEATLIEIYFLCTESNWTTV